METALPNIAAVFRAVAAIVAVGIREVTFAVVLTDVLGARIVVIANVLKTTTPFDTALNGAVFTIFWAVRGRDA